MLVSLSMTGLNSSIINTERLILVGTELY